MSAVYSQVEDPDTLNVPSRQSWGPWRSASGPEQYMPGGHSAGHALSGVNQELGRQDWRPRIVRSLPNVASRVPSFPPPFAADQVGVVQWSGRAAARGERTRFRTESADFNLATEFEVQRMVPGAFWCRFQDGEWAEAARPVTFRFFFLFVIFVNFRFL